MDISSTPNPDYETAANVVPASAVAGKLSPVVRKLARELNVDLETLQGTGSGGRITRDDVLAAAARGAPPVSDPTAAHEDVAFSRVRHAIAAHMTRSLQVGAQLTATVEVDMTPIANLRERAKEAFRQQEGFSLTFLPFIAAATVRALLEHPEFNAHVLESGETARLFNEVNLGIAVGRDDGLIVPVIHGAQSMHLRELAREIDKLGSRARVKGGLKPDDVAGGTFTITNYGSFGALMDTPIISQPQVAILGVGAITKRPAVITVDGTDSIAVRHLMFLNLTYDHRWIDGHRAAQFNSRIKAILEEATFGPDLSPM